MRKRRRKKALKKWLEGRPLTAKEREAVIRWFRRAFPRFVKETVRAMKRFGDQLSGWGRAVNRDR